jgi:23S rRNA pseudouridine955/2504/2580 synthase
LKAKKPLITLVVQKDDDQKRFDNIIRKLFPTRPLSELYSDIRRGKILLNQKKAKPSVRVCCGDIISFPVEYKTSLTTAINTRESVFTVKDRELLKALTIFTNRDVLVLNKPRGYLAHGPHSMATIVENYWITEHNYSLSFRPGPVHRLDRNTTGLQLYALSITGARILTSLFKQSLVKKIYLTLVEGTFRKKELWEDWIDRDTEAKLSHAAGEGQGKKAVTQVIPVARHNNSSCILCLPLTGRTHQIRLQARIHNHPLLGDRKYGSGTGAPYYILHAAGLYLAAEGGELKIPPLFAPLPPSSRQVFLGCMGQAILDTAYALVHALARAGDI